jgi:hypothetical protein
MNSSVEKWEPTGLLEGITDDEKFYLAEELDKLASVLFHLETPLTYNTEISSSLQTVPFVLVRRIIHLHDGRIVTSYEDFLREYVDFMESNVTTLHEFRMSGVDAEAELCALFSEQYAEKYKHVLVDKKFPKHDL